MDKNHGKYSPLFEDNQVDYDEITKELFDNQSYSARTMKGTTRHYQLIITLYFDTLVSCRYCNTFEGNLEKTCMIEFFKVLARK